MCLLPAHLSIANRGSRPLSAQREEPRLRGRSRDPLSVLVGHLGRNLGSLLTATSGELQAVGGTRERSRRFDRRLGQTLMESCPGRGGPGHDDATRGEGRVDWRITPPKRKDTLGNSECSPA
jgi:hypothetical protein